MAKIGDHLTAPEAGWKRFEDSEAAITRKGNWKKSSTSGNLVYYNGSVTYTSDKGTECMFNFYGSKLRIIGAKSPVQSKQIEITIDGKTESYSDYCTTTQTQSLLYEKTDLEFKEHSVKLKSIQAGDWQIDAIDVDKEGRLFPYGENISHMILDVEPDKYKTYLKKEITVDVTINNVKEIAAEDMYITYDTIKLQFLGVDSVDGISLVKADEAGGKIRIIAASRGKDNIVNSKKVLAKIKFKAIQAGEALIDVIKGRISDGINAEYNVQDELCGETKVKILIAKDVNGDEEFTLLDLAIDGRYYGEKADEVSGCEADVVENGVVDDEDLKQIGKNITENPNYVFNNVK